MALSANTTIEFLEPESQRPKKSYGVAGSQHIYHGALVGLLPSGYAKPFVPGDVFAGIADEEFNNTSTSDGATSALGDDLERNKAECRVICGGPFVFALTSVAITDIGRPVYATADNALSFTGHPDAFVGYVTDKHSTNYAEIRMRQQGEKAPNGQGSIVLFLSGHEVMEGTGAVAGDEMLGAFEFETILGQGFVPNDEEDGGFEMEFDAVQEVALCSIRTPHDILPIDKGLTFEADIVVTDKGGSAVIDFDFGFGTALTTNSEASIDHADMVQLAAFHLDGNSDNILAQSDDNTTDVAAVDTTIDNDSTTDVSKKFKIIVRPTGSVEFWIAGARVLPSTTFAMLSTANVAAFLNIEKTSDAAALAYRAVVKNLRVGAGCAA